MLVLLASFLERLAQPGLAGGRPRYGVWVGIGQEARKNHEDVTIPSPDGRVSVSVLCGLTFYMRVTPPSASEEPCAQALETLLMLSQSFSLCSARSLQGSCVHQKPLRGTYREIVSRSILVLGMSWHSKVRAPKFPQLLLVAGQIMFCWWRREIVSGSSAAVLQSRASGPCSQACSLPQPPAVASCP